MYHSLSSYLNEILGDGNRVFNLEMQTAAKKELPYRSRYYQEMIDLNSIEKGKITMN